MVQLKIGNTVLKNNLILGPMAGVTDRSEERRVGKECRL